MLKGFILPGSPSHHATRSLHLVTTSVQVRYGSATQHLGAWLLRFVSG